jgi:hypothetical protein
MVAINNKNKLVHVYFYASKNAVIKLK